MNLKQKQALLAYLLPYATEQRREKMARVIVDRTRHATVVLEDIFQSHNASAVIRSCEIFGIQDVHVIEKNNPFSVTGTVAMGASKWIDIAHYQETVDCFTQLKERGYRIIATTPHDDAVQLQDLPLDTKMALAFGTELTGLSQAALDHADEFVTIPMYGFTESFNISVSVALCLYHTITSLHTSSISWQTSKEEQVDIQLNWLRRMLRKADALEKQFFSSSAT